MYSERMGVRSFHRHVRTMVHCHIEGDTMEKHGLLVWNRSSFNIAVNLDLTMYSERVGVRSFHRRVQTMVYCHIGGDKVEKQGFWVYAVAPSILQQTWI